MRKTKSLPAVVGVCILLAMGATGCGGAAAEIEVPVEIQETALEDMEENKGIPADNQPNDPEQKKSAEKGDNSAEKEALSGKIQSIEADGMVIAQTTVWEDRESGMVKLLDEEEAEKISVRFAEDVKVEYWRIEGGGAGIEKQDRALSDLAAGVTVEMEGYYEGEVYVATLILMEEYV